jgi:hypothetical protein
VGWQAEIGLVKSITRHGRVAGGLVLRQFHQAISYEVPNGRYDVSFEDPNAPTVIRLGDTYHLSQINRQLGLHAVYEQTLWQGKQYGLVVGAGASAVSSLEKLRPILAVDASAMVHHKLTVQWAIRVGVFMNYSLEQQLDPVFRRINWQPYQTGLKIGLEFGK